MSCGLAKRAQRALRVATASLLALALSTSRGRPAHADDGADTEQTRSQDLPRRQANFAWDKTLLRASFSFKDVIDRPLGEKLSSGLPATLVLRAYVLEEGSREPLALAVRTCRITYDLWDEVYRIRVSTTGSDRDTAALNLEGVLRLCAQAQDFPIVERPALKVGHSYFLGVIVDVNPIDPQALEQIRRWVSRPLGSTRVGPGDALFGSFVGLFVRQLGTSDRTLRFRTQAFTP